MYMGNLRNYIYLKKLKKSFQWLSLGKKRGGGHVELLQPPGFHNFINKIFFTFETIKFILDTCFKIIKH